MVKKEPKGRNISIYVKPMDSELIKWAENWARQNRRSLSDVMALALIDFRKKHDK
jgi:hypothetical protein